MSNSSTPSSASLPPFGFDNLPSHVSPAGYDHHKLKSGIVHLGPGGFFLAHLAHIIHDYTVKTGDFTWGITAASLRSPGTVTCLRQQEHQYLLIVREGENRKASVVRSITDTIFAPDSPVSLVDVIASGDTKLVTITVTNKGYFIADSASGLDLSHPDIVADLELELNATNGEGKKTPKTIYWYLLNGLLKRFASCQSLECTPLTIVSLDNIAENTRLLKIGLVQFIEASADPELAKDGLRAKLLAQLETNIDFPVTLVDRITPEVTASFRRDTAKLVGFETPVVIGTESFRQLVIEKGRFQLPDWGQVGVETVDDCGSYWELKFLGLNAAHQVLAIVGQRLGVTYVHEAMADGAVALLVERFHQELTIILGENVTKYGADVRSRFSDSAPMDTLRRVGARGTSKVSDRLLYAIERALKLSGNATVLKVPSFVFACWLLNLGNTDEFGNTFQQDDAEQQNLAEIYLSVLGLTRSGEAQASDVAHILRCIGGKVRDNRFIQLAGVDSFNKELAWALMILSKESTAKAIALLLKR